MRIIISPAKKMNVNTDSIPWQDTPAFLEDTEKICGKLQGMSYEELKKLWKCNDQIAEQNVERLRYMDLHRNLRSWLMKEFSISTWLRAFLLRNL